MTPRLTLNRWRVLNALSDDKTHHGYELSRKLGIPSGTMYPLLDRIEEAGWITTVQVNEPGRHPRRDCRITPAGREVSRDILTAA